MVSSSQYRFENRMQALLDERLQRVEVGSGYLIRSVERAAAEKGREAGKSALLFFGEQVVAPVDRGAQCLVPRIGVATAREEVEPLREADEDLGWFKRPRARRGELEREWERVEAAAELADLLARPEPRALAEERHRLRFR